MSDAGIRQARQSHSREGTAGDHDVAGDAGKLAVSGFEDGARDERREFDHALADPAQGGTGGDDQGSAKPAADELLVNQKGEKSVRRISAGIRRDHQGWAWLKKFWAYTLYRKVNFGSPI